MTIFSHAGQNSTLCIIDNMLGVANKFIVPKREIYVQVSRIGNKTDFIKNIIDVKRHEGLGL